MHVTAVLESLDTSVAAVLLHVMQSGVGVFMMSKKKKKAFSCFSMISTTSMPAPASVYTTCPAYNIQTLEWGALQQHQPTSHYARI